MREIKFRAWIKKEYDQCGGFMLYDPDTEATDYFMVSNGTGFAVVYDEDWLKDDTYDIMQSTGLLDKNGKEIYEGDIVRYREESPCGDHPELNLDFVCSVDWHQSCCGFGLSIMSLHLKDYHDVEIIGNIHENPELLRVKK